MKLKDTVDMMLSDDWKDRFLAEYWQTRIRKDKLEEMIEGMENETLNYEPACDYDVYDIQYRCMEDYLSMLETRAMAEGIDLSQDIK